VTLTLYFLVIQRSGLELMRLNDGGREKIVVSGQLSLVPWTSEVLVGGL